MAQHGGNNMAQTEASYLQKVLAEKLVSRESGVPAAEFDEEKKEMMIETRIYIGLNDAETREQKFKTEKYKGILKNICLNYHVAFTLDIEEGGYFHEDGEYTEETSLVLGLIDTKREIVHDIAKDLCTFFHQESVLVTEDLIRGYFVKKETLFD